MLSVFQTSLGMPVMGNSIVRAHRLGKCYHEKCRPITIKFFSFKLRDQVLIARAALKAYRITVSKDSSLATSNARKRLLEFGKANGGTFKLKYNKLHINNRCYAFNSATGEVYELGPSSTAIVSPSQPAIPQAQSSTQDSAEARSSTLDFSMGRARLSQFSNVSVLFINIRSVFKKRVELCSIIDITDADNVVLTETWLCGKVRISVLFDGPKKFNVYRNNRQDRCGGGVLIAIAHHINFFSLNMACDIELTCVGLVLNDKK